MQWVRITVISVLLLLFSSSVFAAEQKTSADLLKMLDSPIYINQIGQESIDSFKNKYKKVVDDNKKRPYLFYFTSTSVPTKSFQDFLISTYKISKKVPELRVVQYFRGIGNFYDYARKAIDFSSQSDINLNMAKMLKIKIHPKRFKEFNITKVPALIYAECFNNYYSDSNCDIKYIVRGDIDTASALDLFSHDDKQFKIWKRAIYDFKQK